MEMAGVMNVNSKNNFAEQRKQKVQDMAMQVPSIPAPLIADGERFLPGQMKGSIELEHIHRYRFASQLVQGMDVLDIASGEGYGSAFLASFARHVTGVDIAQDAITHASLKYRAENLKYIQGSCADIPLGDHTVDIVVSFETIEHHAEHEAMMAEIKRVLRPDGILVISTPDRFEYSDRNSFHNPFHVKELYLDGFRDLISTYFAEHTLFAQKVILGSVLSSDDTNSRFAFETLGSDAPALPNMPCPQYWVAIASDGKLPEVRSGLFEQSIDELWREISSQSNAQVAKVLRAIAGKNSNALKSQLGSQWYLQQYPDIAVSGEDPYKHWLENGVTEGRLPASDLIGFAEALVSERMQAVEQPLTELVQQHQDREKELQGLLSEKKAEIRQERQVAYAKQRELETANIQTKLKARLEVDAELRMLVERERVLGGQIFQLQEKVEQVQVMHMEKILQQQETYAKQKETLQEKFHQQLAELAQQNHAHVLKLQDLLLEKEAELQQAQRSTYEKQRELEKEIGQIKLKTRDEVDTVLRELSERERVLGDQILQLQDKFAQAQVMSTEKLLFQHETHTKEMDSLHDANMEEMAALTRQHQQREQELQVMLSQKEAELTLALQTAQKNLQELEAKILHVELKARYEVSSEHRKLAERERELGGQMVQQQQMVAQELAALQDTFRRQLHEMLETHYQQELALQQAISSKDDQIRQAGQQAQLNEKSWSDKLIELQRTSYQAQQQTYRRYASVINELNSKLVAVQSAWSWRLTAPLRYFSRLFGPKVDVAPLGWNDLVSILTLPGVCSQIFSEGSNFLRSSVLLTEDSESLSGSQLTKIISPANDIDELLSYEGGAFVTCAYLSLLGRSPDAKGYSYYLGRLNNTNDKLGIIFQIFRGKEAQRYGANIVGLKVAMSRQKWFHRLPVLRIFTRDLRRKGNQVLSLTQYLERERAISEFDLRKAALFEIDALFSSFDPQRYLECNPDVAAAGFNPYEHYICFGWKEGRRVRATGEIGAEEVVRFESSMARTMPYCVSTATFAAGNALLRDWVDVDGVAAYFMEPASDAGLQGDGYTFTRLMQYIHSSRLDLQNAFALSTAGGRLGYAKWFLTQAAAEYGLTPEVFPADLLTRLEETGGGVAKAAREMAKRRQLSVPASKAADTGAVAGALGANLVGYAFGEFGMGEHVRMVARSLNAAGTPFCIIDQEVGVHGAGDASVSHWITDVPRYGINVFHVNADVFPPLYFKFGADFFRGRHNVGYWAWELAECPPEFDMALNMVDEVWAISDFVAASFRSRSPVSVLTMPLAVTVPALDPARFTKAYYGLPEDRFLFFFTFDAASYLDRKNPIAVVRAFKKAFGDDGAGVHLLLKTMNIEFGGRLWTELLEEVAGDARITIMSKRLSRDEVLGLNLACDAFVSLHRSEGFGRCIAEAMAYGKPVVVTNYSGSVDFAKEGTACVVDYRLVPVPEGAYPFGSGQVWAEPDVAGAATAMQRLATDETFRRQIAAAGRDYVRAHFNESLIGKKYELRLQQIRALSAARELDVPVPAGGAAPADVIEGSLDAPSAAQCVGIQDLLAVGGWVASSQGIEMVEVLVDGEVRGEAYYGLLRADVGDAFPGLAQAGRSGFFSRIGVADLALGTHELAVTARSRSGMSRTWKKPFWRVEDTRYATWLKNAAPGAGDWNAVAAADAEATLTCVVAVYPDTAAGQLAATLESLQAQGSGRQQWVLMGADGERFAAQQAGHPALQFAADLDVALACASGEWITLLDAGDLYAEAALSAFREAVGGEARIDFVYADEDALLGDVRARPIFKPGWSPVFLDRFNYVGRPWFARTAQLARSHAGLPAGREEDREHALLKTLGGLARSVCHIPQVLLSRARTHFDSGDIRRFAAGRVPGEVEKKSAYPRVSIVIPTRMADLAMVERCFSGLANATDYPDFEVLVVPNNLRDPAVAKAALAKWPFRVLEWQGRWNWSAVNNLGAAAASGEVLLFLNDDVEPMGPDWLTHMVNTLLDHRAGVVGAHLRYPNGDIQHLGMRLVDQGVRHLFHFCQGTEVAGQWLMNHPREVSAVTGACLMVSARLFAATGGFDESFPVVCNDTDFCLRLRERGERVLIEPRAKLVHYEGVSRIGMAEGDDVARFTAKWQEVLSQGDPFANPNLDSGRDDWSVDPQMLLLRPALNRVTKSIIGASEK